MTRRFAFLAAAAIAVFAAPAGAHAQSAQLPDADPAIWVVKDPDTTIYLFGTFHALDGKTDWFNEEVKTAFDSADEVVLELPPNEDQAAIQQAMMKYALDPGGKPLSSRLSPEGREMLTKALADVGAPANAFDVFKPFFAAITLTVAKAQALGFTGEQGAEAILTKAAKDSGKPMSGLETIEFQLGMFDSMPEAEQIRMLEETLRDLDEVDAQFKRMNDAWNAGDADGFATLMNEMNSQSPAAYKLLISDRNATWAEWIDERLDRPGVVFMGVGAGHLGGKDSVQELLAKRGIASSRVPAE